MNSENVAVNTQSFILLCASNCAIKRRRKKKVLIFTRQCSRGGKKFLCVDDKNLTPNLGVNYLRCDDDVLLLLMVELRFKARDGNSQHIQGFPLLLFFSGVFDLPSSNLLRHFWSTFPKKKMSNVEHGESAETHRRCYQLQTPSNDLTEQHWRLENLCL